MRTGKIIFLALCLAAALPAAAAERALELRLDETMPVQIHNLAGAAKLVAGGDGLVIRARVSADKQEIADAIRLSTRERRGVLEVVVEYPEDLSRIRYDGDEFRRLDVNVEYEGRKLRVSGSRGEPVRVDLEVLVPADARLGLRQAVGPITAEQVRGELVLATRVGHVSVADGVGKLRADTGSGRASVMGFRGDVVADTGSGGVVVENVLGNVEADTGSGNVSLRGIDGDVLADTGSGSVTIEDARGERIVADTGSGGVRLKDVAGSLNVDTGSGSVKAEGVIAGPELIVDTGSGGVAVAGDLSAVRRLVIDTGSGGVSLDSSAPLSLRVDLSSGSGGISVNVPVLSDVTSGRNKFRGVVGDGEGTAKISTGSGSIRINAQ